MADNFEKAKDEILKRTAGNGGPDNADILNAMSALAQDGDDQHSESIAEVKALKGLLAAHCTEAKVRDDRHAEAERRLNTIEGWSKEWERGCPKRIQAAVESAVAPMKREHEINHPPRRRDDPKDANFDGDRRVWLMWSIGSRLTNIIVAAVTALIVMGLSYLFFGAP